MYYAAHNVELCSQCGLSYLLVVPYASLFALSSWSYRFNLQVVPLTHSSGEDSAMEAIHRNKYNINNIKHVTWSRSAHTLCCSAVDNFARLSRDFACTPTRYGYDSGITVPRQWNLDSEFQIQYLAGFRIPWAEFRIKTSGFRIPR